VRAEPALCQASSQVTVSPILQFREVSKDFAGHQAVRALAFSLAGPGVCGLVGPNGAGKTTTLRLAAGFFRPSTGAVLVDGVEFDADELSLKARIGYLPERPPLYPEMSVADYLSFVGALKRMSSSALATRLEATAAGCGLAEVLPRRIGALSAGYRQRVGLAAALLPDPTLLLLDEPTAHLDPLQRAEVLRLISAEGRSRAVLFSSHLLSEVEDVCSRILVMHEGRLLTDTTPAALAAGGVLHVRVTGARPNEVSTTLGASLPGSTVRLLGEAGGICAVEIGGAADGSAVARAVLEAGWSLVELTQGRGALEALLRCAAGPEAQAAPQS
jgi:ABC-2 type transport system ATP-binding protein